MENEGFEKLLFVYNANSGKINGLVDSMHKVFSPSTYECSLCDITFGVFSENKEWKKFRKSTTVEMDFLHKNEFHEAFSALDAKSYSLPVVLAQTKSGLQIFVSTETMNLLESSEDLIDVLKERLN
ncbi:GTPase [Cellulophaga sp. HaHaR_3_176]|uniref:GTPase n=1 Tax=Cellulophaga sp. HaHaR_3_176 TaxID=1942464 RepID=UPI001C1F8FC8|nr:GTPase [Cellulophaga sp. HaHaR_3_176]QWX84198.1 GTPase [Cellulophaga sp. HaHaR_3_176]